jgi:hypothetical protein
MAAPWNEIFRKYDRNDLSFRNAFIALGYKSIYAAKDELDDLAYCASFICAITVAFRKNGIDLTSLALRTQSPPHEAIDALMSALRTLDEMIEELIEFISKAPETDARLLDGLSMLRALFIWKGYLFANNIPPEAWTDGEAGALGSLRILISADSANFVKRLQDGAFAYAGTFEPGLRSAAQETDWPPHGFTELYRTNRDVIEFKCRALRGGL